MTLQIDAPTPIVTVVSTFRATYYYAYATHTGRGAGHARM